MKVGNPTFGNSANLRDSRVSSERAAELLNVAPRTVEAARVVVRQATPALAEKVTTGAVSVSAAAAEAAQSGCCHYLWHDLPTTRARGRQAPGRARRTHRGVAQAGGGKGATCPLSSCRTRREEGSARTRHHAARSSPRLGHRLHAGAGEAGGPRSRHRSVYLGGHARDRVRLASPTSSPLPPSAST